MYQTRTCICPLPNWMVWLLLGLLALEAALMLLGPAPVWPNPAAGEGGSWSLTNPVSPSATILQDGTLRLDSQTTPGTLRLISGSPVLLDGTIRSGGTITVQAPQITVRGDLFAPMIQLESSGLLILEPTASLQARRGADGGPITLQAQTLHLHGQLDADGQRGGPITLAAHTLFQGGVLSSTGAQGGAVQIEARTAYVAMQSARTSVRSSQGAGGTVTIRAERLFSSGQYQATGSTGGRIALLGQDIALTAAYLDVGGVSGGGIVQIGGQDTAAQRVLVTPSTTIAADALENGPGGAITIWAGESTAVFGTLTARGGALGGNGGAIDLSTPGTLQVDGQADAGAPLGHAGRLQLDPKNLTISNAGVFPQYQLINPTPSAGDQFGATIQPLSGGNVVVADPGDDSVASDAGAVYLYEGQTGALLSTLTGSTAKDQVGSLGVVALSNGNYVVASPYWDNGGAIDVGAVTWGNGVSGSSGIVSSANSLVGSSAGDTVGSSGVVIPLANSILQGRGAARREKL